MTALSGIELQRVTKRFGERTVLLDVSLHVVPGQVFGLVGAVGSGKTTALTLLVGMPPTEGQAWVLGQDCVEERVSLRRRIGFAPEAPFFFDYLKGWEVLYFAGEMFGLTGAQLNDTVTEIFGWLGMKGAADEYVKRYTPGMKKRLALGAALVHAPEVLLLDEPTAGVDEESVEHLAALVEDCRDAGKTILLTTESIVLAERLCDSVGVLEGGSLEIVGSPRSASYLASARARMGSPFRGACSAG